MTIKVIVNGAKGRMGTQACTSIDNDAELSLVAALGRHDDLASAINQQKADVVLDLTTADVSYQNTKTIIEAGAHPVMGSTGFTEDNILELQHRSHELTRGGIIAPNFSLSAVLMMRYAGEIAKHFPDVEIIESHHGGKIDSPSGTAIKTAEIIAQNRQQTPETKPTNETVPGARGANHKQVPIHAIRLQGLVANQDVIFGSQGETFTLSHKTIDRSCFMPGIIMACKKVMSLTTLVYGLEHLL